MGVVLRVRLTGTAAELGSVSASDVAKLLLGVERAVARGAGAVLGRQVRPTGRWGKLIETSVRFQLVGIESGSVVGVLELPTVEPALDTLEVDASTLGELGLLSTLRTASGESDDADIAAELVKLADSIGVGRRYDGVTFGTDIDGLAQQVTIDGPARERLHRVATATPVPERPDTLVGVLVEADFEKFAARLRSSDGGSVAVEFDEVQADDIQEALRAPAELVGQISYDPQTSRAIRVELRTITRAEQLAMHLEPGEFWQDLTIDELRAQHAVRAVTSDTGLGDDALTDEEADAFLAALTP